VSPRRNRSSRGSRDAGAAKGTALPVDGSRVRWGVEVVEQWPDGEWVVRPVAGDTGKTYRCPGCDQEIRRATPHVVAWPLADAEAGDRRHWHGPCWQARDRRGARIQRGRGAPRY
jgi:hypothetical protein